MAAKKKGVDLLMVLGPKKPGMMGGSMKPGMMGKKDPDAENESSEYGGEFESAASEAFPDMSSEQRDAFWRAVAACVARLNGE